MLTIFEETMWNLDTKQKDHHPHLRPCSELVNFENMWIIQEDKHTEILDELRHYGDSTHHKLNNHLEFNILPQFTSKAFNEFSLPFGSEKGQTPSNLPKKFTRSPISIHARDRYDFQDFASEYSPLYSPNVK